MEQDGASHTLRAHEIAVSLREAWAGLARPDELKGRSGNQLAFEQTSMTDVALASIFDEALSHTRKRGSALALIALGGYGRRELCPQSDLDVVIAYEGRWKGLQEIASAVWYPLWDAGFKLGHAVRTVRETVAAAGTKLDMLTAHLDARHIAGDPEIVIRLGGKVRELIEKRSRTFTADLLSDRKGRVQRPDRQWGALEPELKQGVGGLRDFQTIGWLGRALKCESLDEMAATGILAPEEPGILESAKSRLIAARFALHATGQHSGDRLTLERQEIVANLLGEESVASLMSKIHLAMLDISQILRTVRLAACQEGPTITSGVPRDVAAAIKPFADIALTATDEVIDQVTGLGLTESDGGWISPHGRSLLREWADANVAAGKPLEWSGEARESMAALLSAGVGAGPALAAMESTGVLSAVFPELNGTRGLTHHNPYHRSTVDSHQFTLISLCREGDPDTPGPAIAHDARVELGDDLASHLAFLYHDAGKGQGGDHSEVGAKLVEEAARRVGLAPEEVARASRIVRHHLLLPDFATRRDLADPNVAAEVARRAVDAQTLRALYVLTVADSRATGPSAWSAWKGRLVRSLYLASLECIEGGAEAAVRALDSRIEALRDRFGAESAHPEREEAFNALITAAPRSFLASADMETLDACLALIETRPAIDEIRMRTRSLGRGVYEMVIATLDRPWLLNRIAGILTLNNFSILGAALITTDDGIAVDVLSVEHKYETEIEAARWEKLRRETGKALLGQIAVGHRLQRRLTGTSRPNDTEDGADGLRLVIDNDASSECTVIELHARDQEGFLYEATRVLADLGLDIHLAKIATMGRDVVDVFYVKDALGQKISNPDHLAEIRDSLGELRDGG
ncbi:MAG: hypothetical protein DCC49_03015 [Acidobacteria bacterium]|nr:MAG: hypothetical protein DCC49_03015 [Acidobacteriota bacterium]